MATTYYVKDTIIRITANGSSKDYKLSEGEDSTGAKYPIKLFCIDNAEYYTTNCSIIFTYDQYTSDLEYTYTYDGSTYTFSGPYSVCKLDSSVTSDSVIISGSTYSSNNGVITTQYPIYMVDFGYTEGADGTISYLSNCSGILVIGKNVKVLSYWVFSNCTGFETVIIDDDLQILDAGCFNNCSGLTKVNYIGTLNGWASMLFAGMLSNPTYYANGLYIKNVSIDDTLNFTNISTINPYTFVNCTGVKTITMDSAVTTIGSAAFNGCEGLTDLTIGDNVTEIGSNAFSYSKSLNSITIPDSVTKIGSQAFSYCGMNNTSLTITIGTGVTTIGSSAFSDSYNTDSNLEATNLYYNATALESGFLQSTGLSVFTHVYAVTIGSNVKNIPANFLNNLNAFTIDDDGKYIWYINIYSIKFETDSVCTEFGNYAFSSCATINTMILPYVGKAADSTYDKALFGAIFYKDSDFSDTSILSVVIEQLVNSYYSEISQNYLNSSGDKKSITYYIPKSLRTVAVLGGNVAYGAFYNCSMLTSISFGANVTSIGNYACSGCTGLEKIIISTDSIKEIGQYAFEGCKSVTSLSLDISNDDQNLTIGAMAFKECGFTSFTVSCSLSHFNTYVSYASTSFPTGCTVYGSGWSKTVGSAN